MKSKIVVTVMGESNTGSTTVMQLISEALKSKGIETQETWEIGGPPAYASSDRVAFKVEAVAKKTKVSLVEFQAPYRRKYEDSSESFRLTVDHVIGIGYSTTLTVMGRKLRHDFGEEPYSQEQARALASRLAAELEIEATDNTKNVHDWVQPH
jgi:hypothetical protein